jgi:glycosyltransferase involved in cell wall biosynthesis
MKQLGIEEEVAREVSPLVQGKRDGDESVDAEGGDDDGGYGAWARGEALERRTAANDRPSCSRHRVSLSRLDDGLGEPACYGRAPNAMSPAPPEISVVIPCLNEEEAVGKVVDQALEGIQRSGRAGEVIVVDNASTDRSAEVAAEHGAIVVREERPGYGSAYLAGFAHARGEYIVMGDADETYPMQELAPFVERLAAGDDLVMGSRFEGTIHGEAMPWLNRHIGNPILTGLLNVLFGVKISDAHCGMRAVRRDALPVLDLHSTGMEFASEMVFKAFRRKLRISEIPIDYYPRVGESKLNRFGDAWRHVKFMLLYSPSWLYFVPGVLLLLLGLIGAVALAAGPITVLGRTWQIHTLFACIFAILLGTQIVQLGVFARAFAASHLGEKDPWVEGARRRLTVEHGLVVGGLLLLAGLLTILVIFVNWAIDGFGALSHEYATAIGFTLLAVGLQLMLGSFFLALLTMRTTEPSRARVVERVPVA